jgi:hypothetical protein
MKGTIIGTDLLEKGDSVKILEINTNTTIYNSGADMLDYDTFFSVLTGNNITELHFIYTESSSHTPLPSEFRFERRLIDKCTELNITYYPYLVPRNSVTVPYIEDSSNKFILRQSFDTTALVDETYCADKFEFFKLMSGSTYVPNTFFNSTGINMDTLSTIDTSNTGHPNIIKKHRYPLYEPMDYPEIYVLNDNQELTDLKSNNNPESNNLIQEFIYDDANLVDGRYSIIRSIDIIYGPTLDVINLGGYRQSTIIPLSFTENEFVENTNKINQKTRYKYITKELGNFSTINYHVDDDTMILNYDGTLIDVDTIQLGNFIKSINFQDNNGNNAGDFQEEILSVYGWDGTIEKTNETLEVLQSELLGKTSANVDTIFIRITLSNGLTWNDSPSCKYYIEESGSTYTRFEKVNNMVIGDKLVVTDSQTNQLTTVEITGLEMEYAVKTIYDLDFEPSDLFLVDIGDGLFGVMHNSCWCPWNYCGYYCNSWYCPSCSGGGIPKF